MVSYVIQLVIASINISIQLWASSKNYNKPPPIIRMVFRVLGSKRNQKPGFDIG
jgi:hypothetical protein